MWKENIKAERYLQPGCEHTLHPTARKYYILHIASIIIIAVVTLLAKKSSDFRNDSNGNMFYCDLCIFKYYAKGNYS